MKIEIESTPSGMKLHIEGGTKFEAIGIMEIVKIILINQTTGEKNGQGSTEEVNRDKG